MLAYGVTKKIAGIVLCEEWDKEDYEEISCGVDIGYSWA